MKAHRTVIEVKDSLDGRRQRFLCKVLEISEADAVLVYVLEEEQRVADLVLPAGTVTIAYFWIDRTYNAYHWHTPKGASLGIYFNVSEETRILGERVRWRDLGLDLLVTPDGRARWLDDAELPPDLEAKTRQRIESAREQLDAGYRGLVVELGERSALWWPHVLELLGEAPEGA